MIYCQDIAKLILDNGHYEGKYIIGHAEIVEHLYLNQQENSYYVELLDSYSYVRMWSSKGVFESEKKRLASQPPSSLRVVKTKLTTEDSLLHVELQKAAELKNWTRVSEIKKQMRECGFTTSHINMKEMINKTKG